MTGRPAPAAPAGASTRDRLLDTAATLFYEQGIHVGVDTVCRAAGVSKKSLYQLFATKDELVAESLHRLGPAFGLALLPAADDDRPPRERILHVFERLEALEAEHEYRGCPLVATAVQVKSPEHPASAVARRHKNALTGFFEHEATRAGAHDPAQLARQLTIVFDGASARSVIQAHDLDGLAVATASILLDAAGIPSSTQTATPGRDPDATIPVTPATRRSQHPARRGGGLRPGNRSV